MKPEELIVLALSSGSSSLKFALYSVGSGGHPQLLISGAADSIGSATSTIQAQDGRGKSCVSAVAPIPSQKDAIIRIANLLLERQLPAPHAIGHRIVHGSPKHLQHCLLDAVVLRELHSAAAFAPLHTPPALAAIRYAQEHFPGVAQVACFDTSFHAELPQVARVLPVARDLQRHGIHRYGFYGLSCESIVHQLGGALPDRLVIAHLGGRGDCSPHMDASFDQPRVVVRDSGYLQAAEHGHLHEIHEQCEGDRRGERVPDYRRRQSLHCESSNRQDGRDQHVTD
jgi:acetate kinase